MDTLFQGSGFTQNPYPVHAELRRVCPVTRVDVGDQDGYLITGHDEACAALADPRLSTDARFLNGLLSSRDPHPAVTRTMLTSDPPRHTRLRRLAAGAFTRRAVERMRPYVQEATDTLIDAFQPYGRADLVADLAVPLPVNVICELLGVPQADRAAVRAWSSDLVAAGRPDQLDEASHHIARYMTDLIEAKRRSPDRSLLTDLVTARDGESRPSESDVLSLAVLLLVAGHETTTNAIGNAVFALLQHPRALDRLRDNPVLIPRALDELLRYDAPVSIATYRHTIEGVTFGQVAIPADTAVLVCLGAANRDPARFPEPDRLDLDRDARGHLSFGRGIHHCLGAHLARAELGITIATLLRRCPDLRLAADPDTVVWHSGVMTRGLTSLPVAFSARH